MSEQEREAGVTQMWRLTALREGATVALHNLTAVLRYMEKQNYMSEQDAYHELMEAVAAIAAGLRKATMP